MTNLEIRTCPTYAAIARNFNRAVADYAFSNLSKWVLDLLADDSRNVRGPQRGTIVCYQFAKHDKHVGPTIRRLWLEG